MLFAKGISIQNNNIRRCKKMYNETKTVKLKMNEYYDGNFELSLVFMETITKWRNLRARYLFIVKYKGERRFFDFYGSQFDLSKRVTPNPIDAFENIVSDAESVSQLVFSEDWCAEFGYDYDNREVRNKAEKIYIQCEGTAKKLEYLTISNDDLNILGCEIRDGNFKIIGEEN